jgi:predicted nucleotide-binding protein
MHTLSPNLLRQASPHNLANDISQSYESCNQKIYEMIFSACKWLIKYDFLKEIGSQGHFTFTEKGKRLKTLIDFKEYLLAEKSVSALRAGQTVPNISPIAGEDNKLASSIAHDARSVFVVHGRNLEARNSLFRFLRSIGLRPLEWSQAIQLTGKASPFIGEILDVAFSNAQAVIVLMTPDDVAQLQEQFRSQHDPPYESRLIGQARPNVLFEAGMAMGRNPGRTIIVELGTLRPFSDIAGRHTIRLSNTSAARQELAQRLETAGCAVDLSGRDWHTEGSFDLKPVTSEAAPSPAHSEERTQVIQPRAALKLESVPIKGVGNSALVRSDAGFEVERGEWLKSAQGVLLAHQELESLFTELEQRIKRLGDLNKDLKLSFDRIGKETCAISSRFSAMEVSWTYYPYRIPDSLENSRLIVDGPVPKTFLNTLAWIFSRNRHREFYDVQIDKNDRVGWVEKGAQRFFTSVELADRCIGLILKD